MVKGCVSTAHHEGSPRCPTVVQFAAAECVWEIRGQHYQWKSTSQSSSYTRLDRVFGPCLCEVIFDCLFALWLLHGASTSASCTWRALNRQHYVVDPLAVQFHHAQTDAPPSTSKCERTSASKASNLHILCEVHFEVGLQRTLFQLKRADPMCAKLIHWL